MLARGVIARRPSSPPATPRPSASSSAAHDAGIHVPDDLSVIGYDDIEMADYIGLTTIRQQLFESGRRGADLLLREIEQRSEVAPSIELTPEVVVSGTTAPPKEG